ncbi:MAG: formylglycine-generating enzyme family protein [Candidatus Accumulibacter sp. UW25]
MNRSAAFPADPPFPPEAGRRPPVLPLPGASAWGDDAYGLWIEMEIAGVGQRFRWIEPGEFWMGSEDEAERYDDEGPRHGVRLTAGFWLADTVCTQALWQAVTGENPSRFTDDPMNPVEQVSWDDVNAFLQRVASSLPGVSPALPTEAEWEYACRAGSEGPFNLGATISPGQANYDGNHPYAGGEKGEFRGKTVPVKTFPPNAWGLYEMHGNVWEWCADGLREYDSASQVNPRGPEGDAPRVVRGGSWLYDAGRLRSASRNSWPRVYRLVYQGFRFSLWSNSQVAEQKQEQEQEAGAERPPQGRGVARDA